MSDLSSHDSSLDTTDSPSIDMDNKHIHNSDSFREDLKAETTAISNSTNTNLNAFNTPNIASSNLFAVNNLDDLLFTPTTNDNISSNQMDFLMMDLTQQTSSTQIASNINMGNMASPLLDFQNITPSLNALTSGLFEMGSNPNTPHLPPLNIEDANSQQTAHEYEYPNIGAIPSIPTMPIVNGIADNIPPPTHDLDWETFCNLIQQNNNTNTNTNNKRKINIKETSPSKKRKLNTNIEIKKKKRGRPRKNAEKINIKKEKKDKKEKKSKKNNVGSDEEYDEMEEYLANSYGTESYVGIRTEDGEVRIQIPPNKNTDDESKYNTKVKFTVFGNACSDKIEDILQPKKRTRYVRGLSEEEKKTRRREQNRNAAARSRARKNAMISKVIQLHQENMGLRAFVAENITQTKILRDEINRLNAIIILNQQQQQQQAQQSQQPHQSIQTLQTLQSQQPAQSSLFDIINQDSSTLFQSK